MEQRRQTIILCAILSTVIGPIVNHIIALAISI